LNIKCPERVLPHKVFTGYLSEALLAEEPATMREELRSGV